MEILQFIMPPSKTTVDITYRGATVTFQMSFYTKGKGNSDVQSAQSPFFEFNEFIATKSNKWQENIFKLFCQVRETIDEENDVERLLKKLNKIYIDIYNEIDLKEVESWVTDSRTSVQVFTRPVSNYDGQRNNNKETTYGYRDYLDLVVYSLVLRLVAPTWGEINNRLNSEFGKNFRDVYSLEILYGTTIYRCPAEMRLRQFMENTKVVIDTKGVLINGLSEEDFYNYMFAVVLLKKVALGDISGSDGTYHLIISIYYYFLSRIKSTASNYNDSKDIQVKLNPKEDKGFSESNSQSVLDVGFSRSKIIADERVFLNRALNDHPRMIETLEPNLSKDLYWESMDAIKEKYILDNYSRQREFMRPIQEVQLNIAKWVLADAVNVVIFDHIGLDEAIGAIGLARAILWNRGFFEFSALISSIAIPPTSNESFISPTYRKNLDTKLMDDLSKVYDLGGNTKSERRNMSPMGCIDLIERGISEFNWMLTLPDSWIKSGQLVTQHNHLVVQSNIRNRIGELMLDVASRQSIEDTTGF